MRYNLNAADESTLNDALTAAGLTLDTENGTYIAPGVTIDIIGTIYKPTGDVILIDGVATPVRAPIAGWHANLIADLTPEQESLLPIIAAPNNPYRIFAGE